MKLANSVSVRVFCSPEEDYEKIKKGFLWLLGMNENDLAEEKIALKETNAKGFSERKIIIIEVLIEKERNTNRFLKRLFSIMSPEDRETVVQQTNRLDGELNFFLRFDKNSVFEKKPFVTDSGECYHIKLSIAAFPKRADVAYKVVRTIFGQGTQ